MPTPRTPKSRARETAARLAAEYPGDARALCELDFADPYRLLVATVLSAQTTDARVNSVTPELFARWPEPADLAASDPGEVEAVVRPTGFFRSKARSVVGLAGALVGCFDGQVPSSVEDLVTLPGVGRKTANVVRSVALGLPGLPVDTHVGRLARLLGLTAETDPVKVERDLCAMLPEADWGALSLRMILHGRRVCTARNPSCERCVLADFCPSSRLPFGRRPGRHPAGSVAARAGPADPGRSAPGGGRGPVADGGGAQLQRDAAPRRRRGPGRPPVSDGGPAAS